MLSHEELLLWQQQLEEKEKELKKKNGLYIDRGFDFLEYKLMFFYSGWAKNLKRGNLYKVYDSLLMIAAERIKKVNFKVILGQGYFYLDFPYRKLHDDLGVSSGSISKDIRELNELGLIRIDPEDRGEEGMGVSRIYFPLEVPEPPNPHILGYVEREYNEDIKNIKESNVEKTKVIKKIEKDNYVITDFDNYDVSKITAVNERRNALIEQAYALWVHNGALITDKLKSEITKEIKYHVRKTGFDFVTIQNAIRSIFDKKITPTDLAGELKKIIENKLSENTYEKSPNLTKIIGKSFKDMVQEEVRNAENPLEYLKAEMKVIKANPIDYTQEQINWFTQFYMNYKLNNHSSR